MDNAAKTTEVTSHIESLRIIVESDFHKRFLCAQVLSVQYPCKGVVQSVYTQSHKIPQRQESNALAAVKVKHV